MEGKGERKERKGRRKKDEKQRSAIEGGIGEGRRRGSGWIRVDRCDGLGVVPVRADRPPGITGPTAVGLLLEEFRNGRCTVHRQRGDRSRRYGPDVLLRESRQMLQETSSIQRIPEQGASVPGRRLGKEREQFLLDFDAVLVESKSMQGGRSCWNQEVSFESRQSASRCRSIVTLTTIIPLLRC